MADFPSADEQREFEQFLSMTDEDAVVLERQGVTAVAFLDSEGKEYVCMESDCPVWGIWSMPDNGASYICIEPWWGICDSRGYAGTVEERPYTNVLEAGKKWESGFKIVIS